MSKPGRRASCQMNTLYYGDNFESLPYRIFLDSNILQILQEYGAYIWDNDIEIIDDMDDRNKVRNIIALHDIFTLSFGNSFEFALSQNSIEEVFDKGDKSYLQWAFDVLDYWMSCIDEYRNLEAFSGEGKKLLKKINEECFNYLSKKDKALFFDAVVLECDAFLTMDIKVWKNRKHIESKLDIEVFQPYEYWEILRPFAALWT